ncbi:MAG TPA: 4Fe-4S dicluster domain-containing protein [Candidatus Binatus sp.]|nr:4Fe-4S dicluster domain-containing protein [Candidatus Binatus sp.]
MPVTVDLGLCIGAGECVKACAFNAVDVIDGKAVIYPNCTDCDACVRACPTHAIASATPSEAKRGGILVVDFAERSGISRPLAQTVRIAGGNAVDIRTSTVDAGAAADLIAQEAQSAGCRIIVLPHEHAGPAVAARVAARLNATLLSGCTDITLDDAGGVRAVRAAYGGIVKMTSKAAPGNVVATLIPRSRVPFAGRTIGSESAPETTGEAPPRPLEDARTVIAQGPNLDETAQNTVRALAAALDANVVAASALKGKTIAPDLYIAVGFEGSTEMNAAVNGAGSIVALVGSERDPGAQIADYVLTGDVETNAKALLASL